jgi:tRNA(fMet)-specific endonuclease VapC
VRILLDTDAYSELKRGSETVAAVVRDAQSIVASAVVMGELLYGFRRGSRFELNLRELRDFLSRPFVSFLPVTWSTADRYSRVASALRVQGTPIPTNDMWIAAHALECGADLVSFDDHFAHVAGLAWVRPEKRE